MTTLAPMIMNSTGHRIVAVIPAAGHAKRVSPLPMSKELYPVGFRPRGDAVPRPKAAAEYLLERLKAGGIREAYVVLRPGKWDIPAYLGDGSDAGIHLAYLIVHVPFRVPFTLDQAFPFVNDHWVALGFPDILFWPENAYASVIQRLRDSTADAVLGLFPTDEPGKVGVVDVDDAGCVQGIFEKSDRTDLRYMWAIAVWKPSFTWFLHQYVKKTPHPLNSDSYPQNSQFPSTGIETPIGDILHAAIAAGLRVEAEVFQEGRYIDIGTLENLYRATLQEHGEP